MKKLFVLVLSAFLLVAFSVPVIAGEKMLSEMVDDEEMNRIVNGTVDNLVEHLRQNSEIPTSLKEVMLSDEFRKTVMEPNIRNYIKTITWSEWNEIHKNDHTPERLQKNWYSTRQKIAAQALILTILPK